MIVGCPHDMRGIRNLEIVPIYFRIHMTIEMGSGGGMHQVDVFGLRVNGKGSRSEEDEDTF